MIRTIFMGNIERRKVEVLGDLVKKREQILS